MKQQSLSQWKGGGRCREIKHSGDLRKGSQTVGILVSVLQKKREFRGNEEWSAWWNAKSAEEEKKRRDVRNHNAVLLKA